MVQLSAPRYIIQMIVSSWHHCNEQHFHIAVICTLHNFGSCRKLDLFIRALLATRLHSSSEKN